MPNNFTTYTTVQLLTPEILLILVAAGIFIGGAFVRMRPVFNVIALLALAIAGGSLVWQHKFLGTPVESLGQFSGPIAVDYLAHYARWFAVAFGIILVLAARNAGGEGLGTEYLGSLLLAVAGVMLAAQARDIVLLFMGLELVSIPTYVLLFLGKRDAGSSEATTKYFFLSIMSSGLLLYGLSFLYGIGGATNYDAIGAGLAITSPQGNMVSLAPLAWLLVLAGLGFKLAIVPFHFYAPDVYQGTTNLNAGLLAVAPKAAGLLALVRLISLAGSSQNELLWQVLVILSILTMTIGNLSALWQGNVRRMLAFSSIAHGGYMLIGLAVAMASPSMASAGIAASLFYLAAYSAASFGAFAVLSYLSSESKEASELEDLSGIARTQPLAAGAMAIFMFSLAGIPPLVGFWGKLGLFTGAVQIGLAPGAEGSMPIWFQVLAIAGVLNSAVAAAYYLRVIGTLFFAPPRETPVAVEGGTGPLLAGVLCAAIALAVGFLPQSLWNPTRKASDSIVGGTPAPAVAANVER